VSPSELDPQQRLGERIRAAFSECRVDAGDGTSVSGSASKRRGADRIVYA